MKNFLKLASRNRSLILGFVLIAAFCSGQYSGFMMILVTLPALLYYVVRFGLARHNKERSMHYLFAIGVVVAASAVVSSVHFYRHFSSRKEADRVVRKVLDFREKQGRFPSDASELGDLALRDRSRPLLHYTLLSDGKPALFYAATFIPFDTWEYDFSSRTWFYRSH